MSGLDPAFAVAWAAHEDYEADWIGGDPVALRRAYDRARAALAAEAHPDATVTPDDLGGVRALRFTPPEAAEDAIVYAHGGSWMVGSPETHLVPCSYLAVLSGLTVWSIDYRLAPEHPFPAQREDGAAAARAVLDAIPGRIALAGDSAGAAVAFWTAGALAGEPRIAAIAAFYGGSGQIPEDDGAEDDGSGLSDAAIAVAYARLGPLDRLRAMPGFDIVAALEGQGPPAWVACGTEDQLVANSVALARQLETVGRDVTLDLVPGLGHSYLHHVARVPAALASLERAARWIRKTVRG